MLFPIRSLIVAFTVLGATSGAWGVSPAPGEYEMHHGRGTLTIVSNESGATSFRVFTVGANGHFCDFSGQIKGDKGSTDLENDSQELQCVISFNAVPKGYAVSSQTEDACRSFCGARAGFEGDYMMMPAGCTENERQERRKSFKSQYDMKDYSNAYETLNVFYNQCRDFMHWMTLDDVRNDLAMTLHHLGRDDACLAILKENTEGDLSLPPFDQEMFQPVAKATSFNLKLCNKKAVKAQARQRKPPVEK